MKSTRSFTLVEVLLALSLMSMLLALAYGGLRASTRAADKGQAILEDSSRIRMAHQFIRRQFSQMIPLGFDQSEDGAANGSEDGRIVFEGDRKRVRFVAPMPGYLGFGGPQVQELEIIPGDEGDQLVLSHALLQNFEEENLYERTPILLMEKIKSAEFQFLGRDETEELTGWVNNWEATGILPEAVSLEIEFTEDVYIQWPLLTASVRIDPSAMADMPGATSLEDKSYSTSIREMIKKGGKQ